LAGPSGSGKTYTSLLFAGALGERVCVIDAERGSSQKYADMDGMPAFDIIILEAFTPENYCAAIDAAAGYDVLVIDSISPEWVEVLTIVDEMTANSRSSNAYTQGWRAATPRHNAFVQAMVQYPGHLIVTIREKTKYVLIETPQGQVPKRSGWEWQQRDYLEYEFDLIGELDLAHSMEVVKTRCHVVDGKMVRKPTAAFMDPIKAWLGTGRKVYTLDELFAAVKATGSGEADLRARMAELAPGIDLFKQLTSRQIEALYESFTVTSTNGSC